MKHIKTISYDGEEVKISTDETGTVYVGDRRAHKPITVDGLTFVWGGREDGLPSQCKISFNQEELALIEQYSKAHEEKLRERARKAKEFDDKHNEGGEGYNPYR